MHRTRLLIALALLVALACAGALLLLSEETKTTQSGPVGLAIVTAQVDRIDAPISGKLLVVAVAADDRVGEGGLLFSMAVADSAEMDRSYQRHMQELQARIDALEGGEVTLAAVEAAEACQAEARTLGEEILALERHVVSSDRIAAKARASSSRGRSADPDLLKLSQWVDARAERYEVIRAMADMGAVLRSDVALAKAHLETARSNLEQARSVHEITRLKEQDEVEAAARARTATAALIVELRGAQTGLAAAPRECLRVALKATDLLRRRNSTREVRAPRDSVVVEVEVEEGQELQAGDIVLSMRVGDGLWVDAYFPPNVDLEPLEGALLLQRKDGFQISATLVGPGIPYTPPPEALTEARPGVGAGTYARLEVSSDEGLSIGDVFEVRAPDEGTARGEP